MERARIANFLVHLNPNSPRNQAGMDSSQPQLERQRGWLAKLACELKRLVVLAALGGALFVAAKYYLVDRLNEEVRRHVEQQLREHYRGLTVSIRSARRISGQGIELRGVQLSETHAQQPLVHIDELFAECDTRLPDFITKPPQLTRLRLHRLKLRACRQSDGFWNLAKLLPLPSGGTSGSPPAATISDGSIEIVDPAQQPAAPLTLRNIELAIQPEQSAAGPQASSPGGTQLRVRGTLAGDHVEKVEIDGLIDPLTGRLDARGSVSGLEFSPRLKAALPHELASLLEPLSTVRGRTFLGFQFARDGLNPASKTPPPLRYLVSGKISEGRVDDARLPEPLSDLEATIRADNAGVVIENLSARCGATTLTLDAQLFGFSAECPLKLNVEARQLALERLPLASLPASAREVFARFSPRGTVDVAAQLHFDGRTWSPDLTLRCRDLSVLYDKFPYRLVGGTGTVGLKEDQVQVRLRFLAGSQFVQCRADVHQPGPNYSGWIEVQSEGPLAIDEKLIAALEPQAQKIVRSFRPRGGFTFQSLFQRQPGSAEIHRQLQIGLVDCSVQHEKFPYPIDKVNGSLQLTDRDWLFRNLTGRNDSAYIVGEGSWVAQPADGNELTLRFTATDVPLADELRQALSPGAQRLWTNLRPRGNIDHLVVGMQYNARAGRMSVEMRGEKWSPGQNVEGRAMSIEPTWFPYRLDNLIGGIHYRDGAIELTGLEAVHGSAQLSASGNCQVAGDGTCRVQLTRLSADRLALDNDLLAALPAGLSQGLARLNLQGPVNMLGGLGITVAGQPTAGPDLDWDLTFDLENGRLGTQPPVEHIHGGLRLVGGSGPRGMTSRGELSIDSAIVRGVQLTRVSGPLLFDSQRMIFGSSAEQGIPGRAPRQLTAGAFAGVLSAGGELAFADGAFQLQATLENADLATIASELAPQRRGLSGKVFGVVSLTGAAQGLHTWRGNGQIRLRDADIYELPVMVSMLKLLSVQRPDRNAFTSSNIDFRVEGDDLALDRIDFSGDAISLKGKGRMTAQREIDLKFHPQFGREEFQLPLFRPLLGEAGRQFMLIEVTGTLDQPQVTRTVLPQLDERLQELFPELARQPARQESPLPILPNPREALRRAGLLPGRN